MMRRAGGTSHDTQSTCIFGAVTPDNFLILHTF